MPSPYMTYIELRLMAARSERRLAAEREEFGQCLQWGMEEAAWRTLEGETRFPRSLIPTLGDFRERRAAPVRPVIPSDRERAEAHGALR